MNDVITSARLYLMHEARVPYLRTALFALQPIPVESTGFIAGVDKYWRMYYSKQWAQNAEVGHVAVVILHELIHAIMRHAERYDPYKAEVPPLLWNIAADITVWDIIERLHPGLMPDIDTIFTRHAFGFESGLPVEDYLKLLLKNPSMKKWAEKYAEYWESLSVDSDGHINDSSAPDAVDGKYIGGGSCADGIKRPWEHDAPSEREQDRQKAQTANIRRRVAEQLRDRRCGSGSAEIERLIGEFTPRKSRVLAMAQALTNNVLPGDDFDDWRRRTRRDSAVPPDVVMPETITYKPRVVFLFDSSGSMRSEDITQGVAEVFAVAREFGSSITVYSGDAEIKTAQRVSYGQLPKVVGGGGTDVGSMIEEVLRRERGTFVLVIVTDCYTPWNATMPPRVHPIICRVCEGGNLPPWRHTVVNLFEEAK